MIYNYLLEIGAVFFMLIILVHFLASRQFPLLKTKLFFLFLVFSISECVINIFSCMAIYYKDVVPLPLNRMLVFAYFVVQAFTYYLFYQYTVSICNMSEEKREWYNFLGMFPVAIHLFSVLTTPTTGFLYYFDKNRQYFQGRGRLCVYLCILSTLILGVIVTLKNRNRIDKRYKVIIFIYTLICCITLLCQYCFPEIIISGFGRACVILLMYLSMQNMGEYKDSVVGTYNSSAFDVMFGAIQKKNHQFAMITLELEKYYQVSIELGNKNAMFLLQKIAERIFELGGRHHVFRMGYAVFTIIVDSETEKADDMVDSLRSLIQEKWSVDGRKVYLNGNIVVQYYPEQFFSAVEGTSLSNYLLEKAALMGNNVNLYANNTLVAEFKRNVDVEQALDYAIKKKRLEVYYQPIYSVEKKCITSAEALVRLFDRSLGFIPPSEFIPIAEKNGRIIAVGNLVLEKTCCFIKEQLLPDPHNHIMDIHINISAIQCMQPDMADQVIEIIDRYQVPPEMIYLEVTEQTAMSTTLLMREHMRKLGERGIRFALDDYGTGNSNCSYLIDFSFQKVKFDRSMTQAYFKKEEARVILQNEIKTLRKLGILIVVEGIETKEEVEEMELRQVDYIQGYYYAKPMPGNEFLEFLAKWCKECAGEKRKTSEVLTLC